MKMICHKCVGDEILKGRIRRQGTISKCGFCKSRVKSVTIEELSEWVGEVLDEHYRVGDMEPYPGEGDDDRVWYEQEGEELCEIINQMIDADEHAVDAVLDELTAISYSDYKDGGTPRYEREVNYVERQVSSFQVEEEWSYFRYELQHRSRFFNEAVRTFLDHLMQDLHRLKIYGILDNSVVNSVVRTMTPDDAVIFYRARRADNPKEINSILKEPRENLGPPPPELAVAGRMNAEGISVFYGALDRKTCVAELRPSLGSSIATGAFELRSPIRVLDFRLLEESYHDQPLSYFQPDFNEKMSYRHLLRRLHAKIRQPILPGSEHEYLITQVLADYLVNVLKPAIDGILFSSVQNEDGLNVVLFSHVLDIESNPNRTSIMGINSALQFIDKSIRGHRIKSIEYVADEHEPKTVDQDSSFDPDDYPDIYDF